MRRLRMEAEGADLIDIGGESTRPGAEPVAADVELARVLPVLTRRPRPRCAFPISIDTYKADVARAALDAGAVDRQRRQRPGPRTRSSPRVVAQAGAALVLMHTRGDPTTMYAEARLRRCRRRR